MRKIRVKKQAIHYDTVAYEIGAGSFMTRNGLVIEGNFQVGNRVPLVFDKRSKRYLPIYKRPKDVPVLDDPKKKGVPGSPSVLEPVLATFVLDQKKIFFKTPTQKYFIDLVPVMTYPGGPFVEVWEEMKCVEFCEVDMNFGAIVWLVDHADELSNWITAWYVAKLQVGGVLATTCEYLGDVYQKRVLSYSRTELKKCRLWNKDDPEDTDVPWKECSLSLGVPGCPGRSYTDYYWYPGSAWEWIEEGHTAHYCEWENYATPEYFENNFSYHCDVQGDGCHGVREFIEGEGWGDYIGDVIYFDYRVLQSRSAQIVESPMPDWMEEWTEGGWGTPEVRALAVWMTERSLAGLHWKVYGDIGRTKYYSMWNWSQNSRTINGGEGPGWYQFNYSLGGPYPDQDSEYLGGCEPFSFVGQWSVVGLSDTDQKWSVEADTFAVEGKTCYFDRAESTYANWLEDYLYAWWDYQIPDYTFAFYRPEPIACPNLYLVNYATYEPNHNWQGRTCEVWPVMNDSGIGVAGILIGTGFTRYHRAFGEDQVPRPMILYLVSTLQVPHLREQLFVYETLSTADMPYWMHKGGGVASRAMCRIKATYAGRDDADISNRSVYIIEGTVYKWDNPLWPEDLQLFPYGRSSKELILAKNYHGLAFCPVIDTPSNVVTGGIDAITAIGKFNVSMQNFDDYRFNHWLYVQDSCFGFRWS